MEFLKDKLYFMPLGGADEIGLNCFLYVSNGKMLVVDAGYGFLGDEFPGTDLALADVSILEKYQDKIEGLVISHAHEDHYGAIGYIWPKLKCPVFATDYACGMMRGRLKEFGLDEVVPINSISSSKRIKLENFDIEFAFVVHNVPETAAVIIRTKNGNIVHATDFRFDDGKTELLPTDFESLQKIGEDGVDLFVCDSTNVTVEKEEFNESDVRKCLLELIPTFKNSVVATCFTSNLTRLETLLLAAEAAGRTTVLVGRSLVESASVAKDCGYFKNMPSYLTLNQAKDIPSDKILYICTGSQANYRSALTLIAKGEKRDIKLSKGDVVIFSSRIVPGNEKAIERLQEDFIRQGIDVITQDEFLVHTTGHSNKKDLQKMYTLLKPKMLIPVHGEKKFIRAHKKFALSCGIKDVIIVHNGDTLNITDGAKLIRHDNIDILGVDRKNLVSLNSKLLQNRKRIMYNGSLFISAVFNLNWQLKSLEISSVDILEEKAWNELAMEIKAFMFEQIPNHIDYIKHSQRQLSEFIKSKIRKKIENKTDMKPSTILHLYKEEDS